AEFQMATNRYSAALGRSGSSVTNVVTKQGTNAVRGSVAFFERDKALNADPIQFSATPDPVPPFHRQQYAGSLGGPIKQDRAWWFASVEDRQQLGGGLVGTRNFATQGIDRSLIQQPLHDWLSTVRADVQATSKDRFGVRESLELEDDLGQSTLDRAIGSASQQQQSTNHYQAIVADWTHTFSSTLLNQFRFADNNFFNDIEPTTKAPQISFPSFQDGASFRVPQQTRQFRLQWSDTLNWTMGSHNMATGGELQRVDADFFLGVFQQGMLLAVENFPDFDRNGDGVVNDNDLLFAVGLQSGHSSTPVVIPNARNFYSATFVQDDWRARRNLTFNLGLRWEGDSDANNRSRVDEINPIVQPFLHGKRRSLDNNWGPRAGFAYSPDDKTVVRGGYGLYYDRITLEIESLERGLDGRTLPINAHLGNVAFLNPDGTFAPIAPTLANPFSGPVIPGAGASGIDIIDNNLRNPMVQQFSLGVERGFGKTMSVRVDGVHNLGTHFIIGRKVGNVFNPDAGGPDTVNNIESSVNTHYDAMLVSARKTFSDVGEFNIAYTLSKSLNYANDDQIPFTSGPIDPNDLHREYGPTPNDQRHRLVISGTSRLPYGFRISPLLTVASSVPMDILLPDGSSRVPLLGRNAGGRQFHSASDLNAFITGVNNAGGIDGTPLPLIDPSAKFASAYSSFDMRLSREFKFGERMRLEGIGEVFNLFNKTNILGTSNLDFSGYQNVLVRDSNDPTTTAFLHSSAFGKPVSAAGGIFGSGGPRAFQLAARFSF
ncbi:MAG TPA: TonB-dependent receptor, partial [Terriglobales bacterium]